MVSFVFVIVLLGAIRTYVKYNCATNEPIGNEFMLIVNAAIIIVQQTVTQKKHIDTSQYFNKASNTISINC